MPEIGPRVDKPGSKRYILPINLIREGEETMKKTFVGLALVLTLASGLLANGLNLNGFGARAAAMGGAFVGLADDYTAVFWNPAGLAQLKKPTFGLTGTFL